MKLGLENFRIFSKNQEFNLAPITVLTGPNNSGKSSLHRAMILMSNSYKKKNGELVIEDLLFDKIEKEIGDFSANFSYKSKSEGLSFKFNYKSDILVDSEVFVNLKYISSKDSNGRLGEIEVKIKLPDPAQTYSLFTISSEYNWHFKKFHATFYLFLLSYLRAKGREQEDLLNMCRKIKNPNTALAPEDEKFIENLLKKGLALNTNKGKSLVPGGGFSESSPIGWNVYSEKAKSKQPYIPELKAALKAFSTPFDDFVIASDFLVKMNSIESFGDDYQKNKPEIPKDLEDLLKDENILTQDDLVEKYKEFEANLLAKLIKAFNSFGTLLLEYNEEIIHVCSTLNLFISNNLRNKIQWEDNLEISNSPLSSFILKIQDWGDRTTFKDYSVGDVKNNPKGLLNESLNQAANILDIIFNEFLSNLGRFIGNTKVLLLNSAHDRHIIFDQETKFETAYSNYAKNRFEKRENSEQEKFIKHWLKAFNLGTSIEIEKIMAGKELIGAEFYLKKGRRKVPLGDNGMGTNQLLLLILQLATSLKKSRFLLEEPESNLHPAFQSQLADLFIDAHKKFGHTFLVETHSEYFIRKLQFQTAKQEISPDDTQIYYFHHPDMVPEGETQIKKLNIRADGMMDDDFGNGFFDESTRLTIDLLKIQNQN